MNNSIRVWPCFLILPIILIVSCSTPEEIRQRGIQNTIENFFLQESELDPPSDSRNLRVNHYPASNERRIDFFHDYIQNKKGIYIGVGTDQNLTFIAWAKSEFAWLMDFDIVAVYVNRIHLFFISHSPTFDEYASFWNRKNKKASFEFLKKHKGSNADWSQYQKAWTVALRGESDVPERFVELKYMARNFKLSTFNNNKADYKFIYDMVQNSRIQAISGDLRGTHTMQNMAKRARQMQLPIRVLYLSNAEDYFRYPETMRKNYLSLPVDENSVVIRTISVGAKYLGFPKGEKFPEAGPLHYNVQKMKIFQEWMLYYPARPMRTMHMLTGKGKETIIHGMSLQTKTPKQLGLIKGHP